MSHEQVLVARGNTSKLYRAIWRWHFYAGLLVLPFLLVLATTGLIMVYGNSIETRLGKTHTLPSSWSSLDFAALAKSAEAAIPQGAVKLFVHPRTPLNPPIYIVAANNMEYVVAIDPATAKVLSHFAKDDTWYAWASNIHGTLLIGDVGDRIIETVAGLGIILVITGLYLWWPSDARQIFAALVPHFWVKGRLLWKELHLSVGVYVSVFLLFFLVSGLAWSGIWGGKIVQPWNTFPMGKYDAVPLSDKTHADMNHAAQKEVPWGIEQTPLPLSGSVAGIDGVPAGTEVNLNSVTALAAAIGFTGQYRINVPQDETGVFSISADSMDGDTNTPTADRMVHVDQYTGKILAEIAFSDYALVAKAMAVGIALHQGDMGLWNTALNTAMCLAVIFMAVSGTVMWWLRRPKKALAVPRYAKDFRAPRAIMVIAVLVAIVFPLTGISLVILAIIDYMIPKRLKEI